MIVLHYSYAKTVEIGLSAMISGGILIDIGSLLVSKKGKAAYTEAQQRQPLCSLTAAGWPH